MNHLLNSIPSFDLLLLTWFQISAMGFLLLFFVAGIVAILYRWFAESKRPESDIHAEVQFHELTGS